MKYRYLDLRRAPLRRNIELRHLMGIETRKYLSDQAFLKLRPRISSSRHLRVHAISWFLRG